jgi:hypothetical protein
MSSSATAQRQQATTSLQVREGDRSGLTGIEDVSRETKRLPVLVVDEARVERDDLRGGGGDVGGEELEEERAGELGEGVGGAFYDFGVVVTVDGARGYVQDELDSSQSAR